MSVVLDTSAILAMLWSEPGAERVDALLDDAKVSAANYSELIAKLSDRGADAAQVRDILLTLDLSVVDMSRDQAMVSGLLRDETRQFGLSLGDRCCLALAKVLDCPVLTADKAWGNLDIDVEVEVIR